MRSTGYEGDPPLLALKLEKATWEHSQTPASNRMGPASYNLKELSSASSHRCLKAPSPRKELNPAGICSAVLGNSEPRSQFRCAWALSGLQAPEDGEQVLFESASLVLTGYTMIDDESRR